MLTTCCRCRVKSLEQDFAETLQHINARRSDGLPELDPAVGWAQQGPVAKASDAAEKNPDLSRHISKYMDCGPRCLGLIHVRVSRPVPSRPHPPLDHKYTPPHLCAVPPSCGGTLIRPLRCVPGHIRVLYLIQLPCHLAPAHDCGHNIHVCFSKLGHVDFASLISHR